MIKPFLPTRYAGTGPFRARKDAHALDGYALAPPQGRLGAAARGMGGGVTVGVAVGVTGAWSAGQGTACARAGGGAGEENKRVSSQSWRGTAAYVPTDANDRKETDGTRSDNDGNSDSVCRVTARPAVCRGMARRRQRCGFARVAVDENSLSLSLT